MFHRGRVVALAVAGLTACQVYGPEDLTGQQPITALGGRDGGSGSAAIAGAGGAEVPSAGAGGRAGDGGGGASTAGSGGARVRPPAIQNLTQLRIEPANATLGAPLARAARQSFKAFGQFEAMPGVEFDVTHRTAFYVTDGHVVGGFPADGSGEFSTRVPASPEAATARAGALTIRAQIRNSDETITTETTTLNVTLEDEVRVDVPGPALPSDADALFSGTENPALAPKLVYPNDGVVVPPNLTELEVHFRPAAASSLYQVRLRGSLIDVRYTTRCYADATLFELDACQLTLGADEIATLAATAGSEPIELSVLGSNEAGEYGVSDEFELRFSEERLRGAIYYWEATRDSRESKAKVWRFEFGSVMRDSEAFIVPADIPNNPNLTCIGCHTLSRAGDRMFVSLGSSGDGRLVYMNDLSRPKTDANFITYSEAANAPQTGANRILLGSFNPDGSEFVAVVPKNDGAPEDVLHVYSGETGRRTGQIDVDPTGTTNLAVSHPDWSPDGTKIAFTAISRASGWANATTLEFLGGGIAFIQRQGGGTYSARVNVVPSTPGKNRFAPTFAPDGELLVYTEVANPSAACNDTSATRVGGDYRGAFCNGYSDPGSRTWAVRPLAGATPVPLATAAAPGVADVLDPPAQPGVARDALMDTFPKVAPFTTRLDRRSLNWVSVSSQRRAGLRKKLRTPSSVGDPESQTLIWLFALDAARVRAGADGSYPGFFLPVQDATKSNHMAQWAERIVSPSAPSPMPAPALPEPPPEPPIPPVE